MVIFNKPTFLILIVCKYNLYDQNNKTSTSNNIVTGLTTRIVYVIIMLIFFWQLNTEYILEFSKVLLRVKSHLKRTIITLIEHSVCARYCSKCFIWINCITFTKKPLRYILLISSFYRWTNWHTSNTRRFKYLPRVTQVLIDRAGIGTISWI